MIAAFILAIGLLGLTMLQTQAVSQATSGRGRATAVYVADWILQQAQIEGQESYFAKLNVTTLPYTTAVFTAPTTSVTEGTLYTFGGFNVDGIQVTNAAGAQLSTIATQVPDANKRFPIYTASWSRRPYKGTAPATTGAQAQEFVVNVTWQDAPAGGTGTAVPRNLSVSRVLRF